MGWMSDLFKGNKHWFSEQWKAVKDNPERLLLGAMTPVGSKVWGKATGKDYKPVMDAWGGPSADVYASGEAKGINMEPAHNSHRVARMVTAMGMAGGAAGGGESAASSAPASTAANLNATNPALIDSAMGTAGYGASSAGAGGGAGQLAGSAATQNLPQMPSMSGQRKRQPIQTAPVAQAPAVDSWGDLLAQYNANKGAMSDGFRIQVNGDKANLIDEDGQVVGQAPNDERLYAALAQMGQGDA